MVKFASPSCVCFISFGFLLATTCVWVWMVCSLHSVTTGSRDRANVSLTHMMTIHIYIHIIPLFMVWKKVGAHQLPEYCQDPFPRLREGLLALCGRTFGRERHRYAIAWPDKLGINPIAVDGMDRR